MHVGTLLLSNLAVVYVHVFMTDYNILPSTDSESSAEGVQDKEKVLPSEPAPDYPLVAQAHANFTLSHSDNLTSTQHSRTQSDGSELNLRPPPSQDFPSSLDHNIAEGTGVGIRESVLPGEGGSLSAHLSDSAGLNNNRLTGRHLGSIGLPPSHIGGGLSVSSHSSSTNLLSSINNPPSSFLPNPSSLSSLTSIGGGGGSVLPSGLRLQDSTYLIDVPAPPSPSAPTATPSSQQLVIHEFLCSASVVLTWHGRQSTSAATTWQSSNTVPQYYRSESTGYHKCPFISAPPTTTAQHSSTQLGSTKSRPQQSTNTHNVIKPTVRGDATNAPLSQYSRGNGRSPRVTVSSTPPPWNAQYVSLSLYWGTSFSSGCRPEPSLSAHHQCHGQDEHSSLPLVCSTFLIW